MNVDKANDAICEKHLVVDGPVVNDV